MPKTPKHEDGCRQPAVEPLEARALFAASSIQSIPDQTLLPSSGNPNPVFEIPDLTQYLTDPVIPRNRTDPTLDTTNVAEFAIQFGQAASATTGRLNVALFGNEAPVTTQNFIDYAKTGTYTNTIFDDLVNGADPNTQQPLNFITGGAFRLDDLTTPITTPPTTPLNAREGTLSNTANTFALDRQSSSFLFNFINEPSLDAGTFNPFGQAIPDENTDPTTGTFALLRNAPQINGVPLATPASRITTDNLIFVTAATVLPLVATKPTEAGALTYSVSSSNPSVVFARVVGGKLTVSRALDRSGEADVTVFVTDPNGKFAGDTFHVNAPSLDDTGLTGTPDLSVTKVSQPGKKFIGGQPVSVSATVSNTGKNALADAPTSTVSFYVSADSTYDTTDRLIGSVAVPPIPRGRSAAVTAANLPLPTTLPDGFYFIVARADSDFTVPERVESNNDRASHVATKILAPLPDLTVAAVVPPKTTLVAGQPLTASLTIMNSGPSATDPAVGSIVVTLFASKDRFFDLSDINLGDATITGFSLQSGQSQTYAVTVTGTNNRRLNNLKGLRFHLIAIVDSDNVIDEGNDANNIGTSKSTFIAVQPTAQAT